jgi:hypothetical protein
MIPWEVCPKDAKWKNANPSNVNDTANPSCAHGSRIVVDDELGGRFKRKATTEGGCANEARMMMEKK